MGHIYPPVFGSHQVDIETPARMQRTNSWNYLRHENEIKNYDIQADSRQQEQVITN